MRDILNLIAGFLTDRQPFSKEEKGCTLTGVITYGVDNDDFDERNVNIGYYLVVDNTYVRGTIEKKFENDSKLSEFINDFNSALDKLPILRFAERYLDLNFEEMYTDFEEIKV